jgi:hypothetical protein
MATVTSCLSGKSGCHEHLKIRSPKPQRVSVILKRHSKTAAGNNDPSSFPRSDTLVPGSPSVAPRPSSHSAMNQHSSALSPVSDALRQRSPRQKAAGVSLRAQHEGQDSRSGEDMNERAASALWSRPNAYSESRLLPSPLRVRDRDRQITGR